MKRNTILTILGILLVVISFFAAKKIVASKKKPKAKAEKVIKTVFVDTVQNTTVPITINSNGSLTAKKRLELYSEVEGVLKSGTKLFRTGQKYSRGQRLLTINADEYYATVKAAKSNLYNLITSIMPDLRLDYSEFYPKWNAYLNNFDVNKATPELPEITSEKERFFITGREIYSTYYNVKNLEQRLAKYYINAPFSGVLIEANVTEGTLIRPGQKLGAFIDTSVYEMEVQIPKVYANLLQVGKEVAIANLDNTTKYDGKVSRVNASINQATQSVTAFVEVKGDQLKEGMYMQAALQAKEEKDAIKIDRSLLLEGDEIFAVKDKKLTKIKVAPIYFSEKDVVLKNVPNGALIVSKNVPGAYTGMLVEIYDENEEKSTNAAKTPKTAKTAAAE